MKIYKTKINNREVISYDFILNSLIKINKKVKLKFGSIVSFNWRTEKKQQELYDKGLTKTLKSNHQRLTAFDLFPNIEYIKSVETICRKYNLINDIIGDSGHFAWGGEMEASKFPIIKNITKIINYNMKYTINKLGDQYLIYPELKVAISIADEIELKKLKDKGLTGEPETMSLDYLDDYIVYSGLEIKRIKNLFNL